MIIFQLFFPSFNFFSFPTLVHAGSSCAVHIENSSWSFYYGGGGGNFGVFNKSGNELGTTATTIPVGEVTITLENVNFNITNSPTNFTLSTVVHQTPNGNAEDGLYTHTFTNSVAIPGYNGNIQTNLTITTGKTDGVQTGTKGGLTVSGLPVNDVPDILSSSAFCSSVGLSNGVSSGSTLANHILISEVVYDPSGLENEAEWFEIFNPTSSPVSLSGWTIKEGGTPFYTFQSGASIGAGGYLIVGNQNSDFQLENTGSTLDIDMQKTVSPNCNSDAECLLLNNASPGDSLTLKDDLGTTVDFVAWEAPSWTSVIGSNGKSISRSSSSDTDTSADWIAETVPTPKTGNLTFIPFITLNGITPETSERGVPYTDAGAFFTSFSGTGNITASGTVNIGSLGANTLTYDYTDASGSLASQVTRSVNIVDTTAPSVTINQGSGQIDPTSSVPVFFTAVFSEPINTATFTTGSISLTGTASDKIVSSIVEVAPNDGTTFRVNVSASSSGTIIADIPASSLFMRTNYSVGSQPSSVFVDSNGNIYTANSNDNSVTKLSPTGLLIGTYSVGLYPYSVFVDPSGNIYTANGNNNSVTKLSPTGSTIGTYTVGANPYSVFVDSNGNIYTANSNDNSVTKLSPTGLLIDTYSVGYQPYSVFVDPSGNIYTANTGDSTVSQLSSTGSLIGTYTVGANPYSVFVDPSGNIYTANANDNSVSKLSPSGSLIDTYTVGAFPNSVFVDPSDNIYTTNTSDNTVTKLSPTGLLIDTYSVGSSPTSVFVDPSGNIYTANISDDTVTKIFSDGIKDFSKNSNLASTSTDNTITYTPIVVDTIAPIVTLSGSDSLTIAQGSLYADAGASWTDDTDGTGSTLTGTYSATGSFQSSGSVDIAILGTYTINYKKVDLAGNTSTGGTRTITVADATKPIISLVGSGTINILKNATYTDLGATWNDNVDGTGNLTASGTVNTSTVGSYTLTYDKTDSSGNIATQVTRTVQVITGSTPGITLTGTSPFTLEVRTPYTDSGATWMDTEDGSGSLTASGSVNTSTLGTYTLTYDYTDTNSNTASQVTRTVNVVDTTKPIITLTGSGNIIQEALLGYTDAGANWTDNYDGTGSLTASGIVNINIPAVYPLYFNYTDTSGNTAIQAIRNITITNPTCPTGRELTSSTGGVVSCDVCPVGKYNPTAGGSCIPAPIGFFVANLGSTSADFCPVNTFTATTGSTSCTTCPSGYTSGTGAISCLDTTAPLITLLGSGILNIEARTPYTDSGATWTDNNLTNNSGSLTASGTVNTNILGAYTLTYNVSDTSGNTATQVTRTVNVVDTTKPIIVNPNPATQTIQRNTNPTLLPVTCSDNYDSTCTITQTGTVDTTQTGNYTLTYTATDSSGNMSTTSITIQVIPSSRGGGGNRDNKDICPNGDLSGNLYDRLCSTQIPTPSETNTNTSNTGTINTPEQEIEKEPVLNQEESIQELVEEVDEGLVDIMETIFPEPLKKVTPEGINYTLTNSYDSCKTIDALNTPNYEIQRNLFQDISDEQIDLFGTLGIIQGTQEGNFEPQRQITRAEFTKIVLISHCYTYQDEDTQVQTYKDLKENTWESRVVSKAKKLGIISGYEDTTFKPDQSITKAEATKILMRMAMIETKEQEALNYEDIQIEWQKKYVEIGETLGIFDSKQDQNQFNPDQGVTRVFMLQMIQDVVRLYR